MSSNLISISKAAKALGVSNGTLRNWEKSGKITCYYTPRGQRRYKADELESFLTCQRPPDAYINARKTTTSKNKKDNNE